MTTHGVGRPGGQGMDSPDGNAHSHSSARTFSHGRPPYLAAFAMASHLPGALFDGDEWARLRARLDLRLLEPITDFAMADAGLLAELEVLITGWDCPRIGARELDRMPRLKAIFHAAGSVKAHLGPEVWERGIRVTTAAAANAYPVAEYTLGMILLAAKGIVPLSTMPAPGPGSHLADIGAYRKTVGVIGASTVGRQVIRLLSLFDFRILLYDPVIAADDPILARVTRVSLDELMRSSAIVSIHAPLLPTTVGLIGVDQLALLAPGATVVNTARALIIDQEALTDAVRTRDVRAILDVTDPEPLPAGHPLRSLPGVLLTPHVAGALGNELRRLGEAVAREVELFSRGLAPAYPVREQDLAAMA